MDFKVFFRNCKLGIFQKFSNVSEKLIEYIFFFELYTVSQKNIHDVLAISRESIVGFS